MKLLIKGARIIDPLDDIDEVGDILVADGKIVSRGGEIRAKGAEIINGAGLVAAPGLIDMHAHLREPGLEAKEDFVTGSAAAAAGGFTTVSCMANTHPPVDSAVIVNGLIRRAEAVGVINIKIIGALTKGQQGKELAEIGDMHLAGAVAISDDGHYVDNSRILKTGLEYASTFGAIIISHAEDMSLAGDGYMHEGLVSAKLGLRGRPSVSEDIAVARDIMLAEYVGAPIHIAHVSTKGAVEIIRQAKRRGVKVSAEVTPHHLTLTDEALLGFSTAAKVNPPLREPDDVEALIEGLKDGAIDIIATDHAPHAFEEKDVEFRYAPNGFTGFETALGVVLTSLYHSGRFTLSEVISRMSARPAKLFSLEGGSLAPGAKADLVIIDPDAEWVVDSAKFYTRGKCTPFEGKTLKGRAVMTIAGGKIVMENQKVRGTTNDENS